MLDMVSTVDGTQTALEDKPDAQPRHMSKKQVYIGYGLFNGTAGTLAEDGFYDFHDGWGYARVKDELNKIEGAEVSLYSVKRFLEKEFGKPRPPAAVHPIFVDGTNEHTALRVTELEERADEQLSRVSIIQADLEAKIAKLSRDIDALVMQVSSQQGQIAAQEKRINALNGIVTQYSGKVTEFNHRISKTELKLKLG